MKLHQQIKWLLQFVETNCRSKESWTASRVLDWMCNIGLPPVGRSEMPYVCIWKGIKAAPNVETLKRRFAERLAESLPEIESSLFPNLSPSILKYEQYPGEAAANLWALMALLEQPVLLGPATRRFVSAFSSSPMDSWLRSEESIRGRLLSAAIFNQDSDEFVRDWKALAQGLPLATRFQTGYRGDGVEGLILAPVHDLNRLRELAEAIAGYGQQKVTAKRQAEVAEWLARIRDRFKEFVHEIDVALIELAHEFQWPNWIVLKLPYLSKSKSESTRYVWTPIVDEVLNLGLEESGVDKASFFDLLLCHGEVIQIDHASQDVLHVFDIISENTNLHRIQNPFKSTGTIVEFVKTGSMRRCGTQARFRIAKRLRQDVIKYPIKRDKLLEVLEVGAQQFKAICGSH